MTERVSLADRMYDALMRRFMAGRHPAGSRLNIGELSRELAVSQTPLREALARLENTGLVERSALKGYRVARPMSAADVRDLTEARCVVEPALASAAAGRVPDGVAGLLDRAVDDLARAGAPGPGSVEAFERYCDADERFHSLIASASGNPYLESAFRSLAGQIQRFRMFSALGSAGAAVAAVEHARIRDAVVGSDPERAATAMLEHIRQSQKRRLAGGAHPAAQALLEQARREALPK